MVVLHPSNAVPAALAKTGETAFKNSGTASLQRRPCRFYKYGKIFFIFLTLVASVIAGLRKFLFLLGDFFVRIWLL